MARRLGDCLITGILDDDTVESYKRKPVIPLESRMKIASRIRDVDLVIPQFEKYPLENLKILHNLFPDDKLVCTHGDDWNRKEFKETEKYLNSIGGELILLPYYKGTNTTAIINDIISRHRNKEKRYCNGK